MPDIVPNLLHLSSEVVKVAELLEAALDLVLSATDSDAAAIARPALPHWSIEAIRGVNRSAVPLELASEALERDDAVAKDRWRGAPLMDARREAGSAAEGEFVLMVRGNCPAPRLMAIADRLSDALRVVEQKERALARINRLEAIVTIINQWHQTNEMETLFLRMAEAAMRL